MSQIRTRSLSISTAIADRISAKRRSGSGASASSKSTRYLATLSRWSRMSSRSLASERMSSRSKGVMKVVLRASKIWRVIPSPSRSRALSCTPLTLRSSRLVAWAISEKTFAPSSRFWVAFSRSSWKRSSLGMNHLMTLSMFMGPPGGPMLRTMATGAPILPMAGRPAVARGRPAPPRARAAPPGDSLTSIGHLLMVPLDHAHPTRRVARARHRAHPPAGAGDVRPRRAGAPRLRRGPHRRRPPAGLRGHPARPVHRREGEGDRPALPRVPRPAAARRRATSASPTARSRSTSSSSAWATTRRASPASSCA